jgi:hypothetical protein
MAPCRVLGIGIKQLFWKCLRFQPNRREAINAFRSFWELISIFKAAKGRAKSKHYCLSLSGTKVSCNAWAAEKMVIPKKIWGRPFLVRFLGEQKMNKYNFKTKKVTCSCGEQRMNKYNFKTKNRGANYRNELDEVKVTDSCDEKKWSEITSLKQEDPSACSLSYM